MTAIFVFGSNLAGRHGAGAALVALQRHGARPGRGEGAQGNSYAIPTKDGALRALPLDAVALHVARFLAFAAAHPEWEFEVTPVGCGLAGFSPHEIAPMFASAPENCSLPSEFLAVLRQAA